MESWSSWITWCMPGLRQDAIGSSKYKNHHVIRLVCGFSRWHDEGIWNRELIFKIREMIGSSHLNWCKDGVMISSRFGHADSDGMINFLCRWWLSADSSRSGNQSPFLCFLLLRERVLKGPWMGGPPECKRLSTMRYTQYTAIALVSSIGTCGEFVLSRWKLQRHESFAGMPEDLDCKLSRTPTNWMNEMQWTPENVIREWCNESCQRPSIANLIRKRWTLITPICQWWSGWPWSRSNSMKLGR
jgi:hypothetical protein